MLVEEPSYLAALQCFGLAGARLVGVACDEDGLDPDALAARRRRAPADRALHVPTFQNPTGRTLPRERREAIAALAAAPRLLGDRGRPLRRAALPRRAAAGDRDAARRRGPHAVALDAQQARRARACGSAGSARPTTAAPAAGARQAGRRPAHLDRRPGRGRPLAASTSTSTRTSPGSARAYSPRRDALLAGLRDALPDGLDVEPARRRHVRLGAAARRATTPRRCSPRARSEQVAFVPGYPFFAARPTAARCACRSRRTPRRRSPRAWRGCARLPVHALHEVGHRDLLHRRLLVRVASCPCDAAESGKTL